MTEERPGDRATYRVGLAMGGGAARGYFTVGALKALSQVGVAFDCLAGTSAGAIVSSLYTAGIEPDQIAELMRTVKWAHDILDLKKTGLNVVSRLMGMLSSTGNRVPPGLFETSQLSSFINTTIGGKTFSEIRPLILTATDICTGEKVLFSSAKVARDYASGAAARNPARVDLQPWEINLAPRDVLVPFEDVGLAARASACVPGIMESVQVTCPALGQDPSDRFLNDGGLCEQVPVKVLRTLGCEKVLAISLGFVQHVKSVFNPLEVATNSVQYLAREQIASSLKRADFVLYDERIEEASLVTLDPRLIEMGYRFTMANLPRIRLALGLEAAPGPPGPEAPQPKLQ
ncbi:MAG: patatin-like phospholipase family protein [Candidatus Riflebacteria bacterium]|nr:patatin-like phospholipase family protein [Candidatus Riflebacteria bacterium]